VNRNKNKLWDHWSSTDFVANDDDVAAEHVTHALGSGLEKARARKFLAKTWGMKALIEPSPVNKGAWHCERHYDYFFPVTSLSSTAGQKSVTIFTIRNLGKITERNCSRAQVWKLVEIFWKPPWYTRDPCETSQWMEANWVFFPSKLRSWKLRYSGVLIIAYMRRETRRGIVSGEPAGIGDLEITARRYAWGLRCSEDLPSANFQPQLSSHRYPEDRTCVQREETNKKIRPRKAIVKGRERAENSVNVLWITFGGTHYRDKGGDGHYTRTVSLYSEALSVLDPGDHDSAGLFYLKFWDNELKLRISSQPPSYNCFKSILNSWYPWLKSRVVPGDGFKNSSLEVTPTICSSLEKLEPVS
jgi:hypothetical protein